ncbi:hypothetical protein [Photobacterium sp. TY1-4]|uniref:hypothetical protein n=1 Tax=Photobacterium sp. TY1-4 TaxID=2899122 RepID=UPI0021BF4410|nr:hypothetical protein [Photobacterium sp. TY1-4]UXI03998.1 hypothetical protein NH461_17955 [Photobacterium sp. TY1-4]
MAGKQSPILKWFKVFHGIGLIMIAVGVGLYALTPMALSLNGMLVISCLIGIGGVLVSPFPVALFFQWANASAAGKPRS